MRKFLSRTEVEALAAHALEAAARAGAWGADVLYSEGCANGLTLKDGEIEESTSGSSAGLGLRTILSDGRQGIAYGNRLDMASVDALVEWSLHNARASQPEDGVALYDGPLLRCEELELEDERIGALTAADRMEYCLEMTREARAADKRVVSVRSASWRDGWGASFFATSKGLAGWERGSSANCGVLVLAQSGEYTEMGGYGMDSLRLDELDAVKCARRAAAQTVAALGGSQLETGAYTIMIDPEAAAALVDVIGGLFCASDVLRGRSMMKGKLGEAVASSCVSLTDDGRIPWKPGSSSWDSEGVPTSRTELIKGGVATAYLYNLQYAAKDGSVSTGNCSRGMSSLPDVGTTNLILEPGESSPEELRSRIGRGMYVTEFMGLHTIDPISGDFSIGAKGHRIENGGITTPVSGVTMASNLLEFMKNIAAVGSDLTFSSSTAAPALVVDNVVIAGK
ncbi:MAG: TldD/PmbA family protein [Synergistaceae bacterium]|nr:TldD/PmbA family protein [Synergistaceae bacterium]